MKDTIFVLREATQNSSAFWPTFWGALIGILTAMITHFLQELIKKSETSYDAICEFEMYLGDLVKFIGSTKGLIKQIRAEISGLKPSAFLSIQFKAEVQPIGSDDIKYLTQSDLKNEWVSLKFRIGAVNSDMTSAIDGMKAKAEFYNSNKALLLHSGFQPNALFQAELAHFDYLEEFLDEKFDEVIRVIARVRKHLQKKSLWIRLKSIFNFQSKYRPTEEELDNEVNGVLAEIEDAKNISNNQISKLTEKTSRLRV